MAEKGFVPTMGALHAGHAALISAARKRSNHVVVSIFVNPLQFNDPKDLEKYPRTPDHDRELALAAGASEVWFPTVEEIYPSNPELVKAGPIGEVFEGFSRPGHFDGVLTVVKRLFDLVQPDFAIFGEKDFQQLFLIKQMVRNFNLPIEIIAHPTIREADGLALSSRNIRLSSEDRAKAAIIYKALNSSRDQMNAVLASEPAWKTDYATIINPENFKEEFAPKQRAIIAGWIGGIRLIDNMEYKE
ncbi:MAG: pantoate--beta-alanine ligase [Candidatus Nanopelagicaceae bacterium]|nr:pantoate--beta-alanine ligase [Candidatus Nanopelagicaceae bacterium]